MFEYSENNYIKFGYNNSDYYCRRNSKDDIWIVDHGKCSHKPSSFKDECIIAAKKIYDSTDLPINIMFSGGIDGEVAIRSFLQARIPFQVFIMRFNDDLNLHDMSFAIIFCERNNIKYTLVDLNLITFLENEGYKYAEQTQSWHPTMLPIMWLTDQVDGLPIITSGEITLKKQISDDYIAGVSQYEKSQWDMCCKELIHSFSLHFIYQDRPAIPKFFEYTPEILYSFLSDPIVIDLVNDKIHGKLGLLSSKYNIYANYYDLAFRNKYTGFEKLQEIEAVYENKLTELYGHCNGVFKIEYSKIMEKLKYDGI